MAFRWRADGGPTLCANWALGIYFSADDYNNGYMQALAMVKYDGTVFWPPIVKLRSTCNIDITYFPFDDQKCKLKMGSWAYDGFQVIFNATISLKAYTVKPVLSGHSEIDKTNKWYLNEGRKYCRMLQSSILQYFWPALNDNWSWKPILGLLFRVVA